MKKWCYTKKTCYPKNRAEHVSKMRNASKGYNGHAYHCEKCDWWHVTKQPMKWPLDI